MLKILFEGIYLVTAKYIILLVFTVLVSVLMDTLILLFICKSCGARMITTHASKVKRNPMMHVKRVLYY
jgi:hypothetical protein